MFLSNQIILVSGVSYIQNSRLPSSEKHEDGITVMTKICFVFRWLPLAQEATAEAEGPGKGYFAGHWSAASAGMPPLCCLQLHSTQLIVFLWKVGGNSLWFRLLSHQVFFLSFHFSLFLLFDYILFFVSPCLNYPFIFAHCGQQLQRHFLIPSIATGAQEVMILQPGFLPFFLLIF